MSVQIQSLMKLMERLQLYEVKQDGERLKVMNWSLLC